MPKLNQIVAVVNGKKTKTQKEITELYKKLQKPDLFNGLVRTYTPLGEDGDTLPPEKTMVKETVDDCLSSVRQTLSDLFNTVYTQEVGNIGASGDITVDGEVLLSDVPVTYLMFLEKQLVDLHTFINTLPTLDDAYTWSFDQNKACFVSDVEVKNRDLKTTEFRVVYEATDKHPAQIAEVPMTKKVGEFTTTKLSGACGVKRKKDMLDRITKLQEAVKFAREQANSAEVQQYKIADELFDFVLNTND